MKREGGEGRDGEMEREERKLHHDLRVIILKTGNSFHPYEKSWEREKENREREIFFFTFLYRERGGRSLVGKTTTTMSRSVGINKAEDGAG